jgi:hypothetical protein
MELHHQTTAGRKLVAVIVRSILRDAIAAQAAGDDAASHRQQESSLLLQRIFASLRARGVTKHKLASTVHIYPKDIDELVVFGLARGFLDGPLSSSKKVESLEPHLAVVPSGG